MDVFQFTFSLSFWQMEKLEISVRQPVLTLRNWSEHYQQLTAQGEEWSSSFPYPI